MIVGTNYYPDRSAAVEAIADKVHLHRTAGWTPPPPVRPKRHTAPLRIGFHKTDFGRGPARLYITRNEAAVTPLQFMRHPIRALRWMFQTEDAA